MRIVVMRRGGGHGDDGVNSDHCSGASFFFSLFLPHQPPRPSKYHGHYSTKLNFESIEFN